MTRIDLAWIKAALDVIGRALTVMLVILLIVSALPTAAGLNLHYRPRTELQHMLDTIAFVSILAYAAVGAGMLIYSLIGERRLTAIFGFAVLTLLLAAFLILKMSVFG